MNATLEVIRDGSSPRVRGTPGFPHEHPDPARFIPACAGNTRCGPPYSGSGTVHPRVCGEHHQRQRLARTEPGSSPRVRGTLHLHDRQAVVARFIPTCAGNTLGSRRPATRNAGSSPRVRGTRAPYTSRNASRRFIPACAGNTPATTARTPRRPVHPRVCGEHSAMCSASPPSSGSSPRVRGTPRRDHGFDSEVRFIPACAGNTVPRVTAVPQYNGSSPRVRGTQGGVWAVRQPRRFIPACAGNTSTGFLSPQGASVHPRVCGEHTGLFSPISGVVGSSPRVRGTPPPPGRRGVRHRFIPACAGNTWSKTS